MRLGTVGARSLKVKVDSKNSSEESSFSMTLLTYSKFNHRLLRVTLWIMSYAPFLEMKNHVKESRTQLPRPCHQLPLWSALIVCLSTSHKKSFSLWTIGRKMFIFAFMYTDKLGMNHLYELWYDQCVCPHKLSKSWASGLITKHN